MQVLRDIGFCYSTSISITLGRIRVNISLIIAILIGYLIKDTKNIKKKEEGLRNSLKSVPSTPNAQAYVSPNPYSSKDRYHVTGM